MYLIRVMFFLGAILAAFSGQFKHNVRRWRQMKAIEFLIDSGDENRRIDNFLFSRMKDIPKSRIYRALREGDVKINDRRIKKADFRLSAGERLTIRGLAVDQKPKTSVVTPKLDLNGMIIFEDEKLLVLNKPAGLSVHAGSNVPYGLIETLRETKQLPYELIHRLDKPTSGCLLIAKNSKVLREWQEAFRTQQIEKVYLAVVLGKFPEGKTRCDAPLKISVNVQDQKKVCVDPRGVSAFTEFKCLKTNGKISLVEAYPKTGRTHQIRVHLAYLGYPILGDKKYGNFALNKKAGVSMSVRLMLHAHKITWKNTSQSYDFLAPAPKSMMGLFEENPLQKNN